MAAQFNNESRLISIPPEILLQITSSLTTPDYGALRLTCKHIEATLYKSFAREFFTKRQFMFTEFSLQALVNISKSRLSSCLKHIIFSLERPSQPLTPGSYPASAPHGQLVRYNRSVQEFSDHVALLNTGQDVEMITEALSNLRSLDTIGMRDFYSRSRYRDFPNTEWKSYGVSTFEQETGRRLELPRRHGSPDQANFVNRIFLTLLRALGKSTSRPKQFEVILRNSTLNDQTFNFPKFVESTIQPVLAKLNTIFLELNFEFPPTYVNVDNVPVECSSYYLRKFISRLTQIEHLRLNFYSQPSPNITDFLSWISKPVPAALSATVALTPPLPESPRPIDLSNLRQLDIGMVTIEPQTLLSIVEKYQSTLRTISLHKVTLVEHSLIKSKDKVNLWLEFFEGILALDVKLTYINLSYLSQAVPGTPQNRSISFKNSLIPLHKKWAGPEVQKGLKDIVDNIVLEGQEPESDSDSDGNSGSDDSMIDLDEINEEEDEDASSDEDA